MVIIRGLSALFFSVSLAACSGARQDSSETKSDAASPSAQVAAGARPASFNQCASCHAVKPDQPGIGPSLAGVFGAKVGHVGDYAYSQAMRGSGHVWDAPSLDAYLTDPRAFVPGTKMSFGGIKDADERAAIIAYLKTL